MYTNTCTPNFYAQWSLILFWLDLTFFSYFENFPTYFPLEILHLSDLPS